MATYKRDPHRCYCEVVKKESSAVLHNIVLDASLDLSVLERIKVNVPMKTTCEVIDYTPINIKPPVVEYRPPPPKPQPKPIPSAKVAYVGEVYRFTVIIEGLEVQHGRSDGYMDPYFYFWIGDRHYYGGRERILEASAKGRWNFPLVASELKLAARENQQIKIVWMDYNMEYKETHIHDEEIGTTVLDVETSIKGILQGRTRHEVTDLKISGSKARTAFVRIISEKQAEPEKTINRTNSYREDSS